MVYCVLSVAATAYLQKFSLRGSSVSSGHKYTVTSERGGSVGDRGGSGEESV